MVRNISILNIVKKTGWHYLDDQKKIEWTFTENDVSWADGSVQLPVFILKEDIA